MEESALGGRAVGPRLAAWMVHHAAWVICVCSVGTSGLTPFRRLKGRRFGTPLAGFGQRVWLRELPLEKVNKFNPRCVEARLLGFCLRSSRYIVVDFDGRLRFVRTVKRTSSEGRWTIASPRDPFSAGDLGMTPAEFTCSKGTPEESHSCRSTFGWGHQLMSFHPTQIMDQSRGGQTSSREIFWNMERRTIVRVAEHSSVVAEFASKES